MAILVVGSMAYDTVETPRERRERQLGGAATFFALAAGPGAGVRAVAVVGDDFREADLDLLREQGVDLAGVERAAGPSFHWSGRYHADFIERDTLATDLGVFADFQPLVPADWVRSEYLFLANIHPALQGAGAGCGAATAAGGAGHHEPVDRDHAPRSRGRPRGRGRAAGQRFGGPPAQWRTQPDRGRPRHPRSGPIARGDQEGRAWRRPLRSGLGALGAGADAPRGDRPHRCG